MNQPKINSLFSKVLISFLFLLLILPGKYIQAQVGGNGCPNANFGYGNFTNWVAYTGTYNSCCSTVGVVAGRHTIMSSPINDPIVGTTCANGPLPVIPPGSGYSARLGNSGVNYQADRLRYTLTVDSSNALFIYKYAVVLQDPNHSVSAQPKFDIKLLNQAGQQIGGSCGVYSVAAGANIPGFNSCGQIRWKDWTAVGVNLLPFYGQSVTIEFTTYDCNQGGHYGYAYIAADCSPLYIDVAYCPGDVNVVLSAPPGFASYAWETGATTQSITLNNPVVGDTISVTMTSFSNSGNCVVTLDAVIVPTVIDAGFEVNSPCEDMAVFQDTSNIQNGFLQSWLWDFGDGTTSTQQHPTHTYPFPGTYNVTLIAFSKPGLTGCSDTIVQPVTIYPKPDAGFTSQIFCPGVTSYFSDTSLANDTNGFASWMWYFPGASPVSDTLPNSSTTFPTQGTYNVSLVVTNTNGCKDSVMVPVNSTSFPLVDFTSTTVCNGNATGFADISITDPNDYLISWDWDFGDGSYGTGQNPSHTYATAGTYLVEMLIESNVGCIDSITKIVTVDPNPVTDFTTAPQCLNDSVQFTDMTYIASPGVISTWQWMFGDGNTSTLQNPSHLYSTPGSYPVTLMISTTDNCTGVFIDTVDVYDYPQTSFSTYDICLTQTAVFTNNSVAPSDTTISNFIWDFGDGTQNTTDENPTHLYTAVGTYNVQLINYSENLSCPDTFVQQIVVNPMAQAGFTFNDTCVGKTTYFNDQSTGQIVAWEWDFGDGSNYDNNQNPTHVFPGPGIYDVRQVVTSFYGCMDTLIRQVEVFPLPVPNFSTMNVCEGEATFFYDISYAPTGFSVVNQAWDFGDGNTAFGKSPVNTFADTGDYLISLYATTNEGCVDSIKRIVEVHPFPEVDFQMNQHEGCFPVCVQFSNLTSIGSGDSIRSYAWNFGDGGTSSQHNLQYCYSDPGTYSVTLEATSNYGCTTSKTFGDTVNVYGYPNAAFRPSPPVTTLSHPIITFVNNTTGGYTWNWNFGDNTGSSERDPSHKYVEAGTYLVTLYTETEHGCSDSAHYNVEVEPEFTIFIPNAFSPNDDGLNDVFKPKGIGVEDYELKIFNRWGKLVFESNNIEVGWDGYVGNGGKTKAPQDVYVYIIKAVNVFGNIPIYREGHLTLAR